MLWHTNQREAICLAMMTNMIRDLSALCKHGFVRSEICASWLPASSLQGYANDSYANEHHSELSASAGATVILSIHFDPLAFPTPCPAVLRLCLSFVPLSHLCLSFCLRSDCSAAVDQTYTRWESTGLLRRRIVTPNDIIFYCNIYNHSLNL